MAIDAEDVRHVARLARLAVAAEDVPRYAAELGRILEHVARLQAVDTADVPPTGNPLEVFGVVRPDAPAPGLGEQEALANAPAQHGGMFLVPRVVEN